MHCNPWAWGVNQSSSQSNRFVYFKQNNSLKPKSVLINPNFKPKNVHINPNFTQSGKLVKTSQSVHINPNVFKNILAPMKFNITQSSAENNFRRQWSIDKRSLQIGGSNVSNLDANVNRGNSSTATVPPVIATRTKIVRRPINEKLSNSSPQNERIVLQSKYKLVKNTTGGTVKPLTQPAAINPHKLKSKFKIDNRKSTKKVTNAHKNIIPISPRKIGVSFIKIEGITYKKSRTKLQRSNSFEDKNRRSRHSVPPKRKNHKIINKNGVRYEVNVNRRTLKRMTDSGTKNAATKKPSPQKMKRLRAVLFAKKNFIKSKYVVRKSRNSLHPTPSKLKKCNITCSFYRKFGRCRGKDRGICNKIHDPSHITICPRFLQGACVTKTCLLSHNVSPEKMPTCKFYLEGMCSKEDCPYLHVKVNPKADICRDFLKGYCKNGKECDKRHHWLCPDYEKNGTCLKKKCPWPHQKTVSSVSGEKKKLSVMQKNCKSENGNRNCPEPSNNDQKSLDTARYYKESINSEACRATEIEIKRSKLDGLPAFIPFAEVSKSTDS